MGLRGSGLGVEGLQGVGFEGFKALELQGLRLFGLGCEGVPSREKGYTGRCHNQGPFWEYQKGDVRILKG